MPKKTRFFIFSLIFLLIIVAGNYLYQRSFTDKTDEVQNLGQPILAKKWLKIGENRLEVEIAKSVQEQALGLSYREELGSDGMLFILPSSQRGGFWMKDMKFDIDLVWIKSGKISQITPNVSRFSYAEKQEIFYPDQEVDWVLELEAGRASLLGLEPGQLVVLE